MDVRDDDIVVEESDEIVEDEDEALETTQEPESEGEDEESGEDSPEEEEDRVVTIGDEPEEEEKPETPGWVKKVRKVNRKLEAEVKALKRQLQERSTESAPPVELGPKPTLKGAKYDEKTYQKQLEEYYERERQVKAAEEQKKKAVEEQQKAYEARRVRYTEKVAEHGFRDFDDAQEIVTQTLDEVKQGAIVQYAEDSALMVYALGKNPKALSELAAVVDPAEFVYRLGKLEGKLKVKSRKAPAPETRVSGGTGAGSVDSTLERLRAEAAESGDFTKVRQYKAKMAEKAKG